MEGATPLFTLQSAPPSRDDNCAANCALFIPFSWRVASLHSDPCGKAVESARKLTAEKQQTTNGPQAETGTPGGCTQPNISDPHPRRLPPRLTASDSGLILG